MANDKITMLKLKRMLQLLDADKSMNDICRDSHMSKRTVYNYKQRVTSSQYHTDFYSYWRYRRSSR